MYTPSIHSLKTLRWSGYENTKHHHKHLYLSYLSTLIMPRQKSWSAAETSFILYCLTVRYTYEETASLLEQTATSTECRSVTAVSDKARSLRAQYQLNDSNGMIDLVKAVEFLERYLEEHDLTSPKDKYSKIPSTLFCYFILTLVDHIEWTVPSGR